MIIYFKYVLKFNWLVSSWLICSYSKPGIFFNFFNLVFNYENSFFIPADSITFVRLPSFLVIRQFFFHKIEHIWSKVHSFYFLNLSKPYPGHLFILSLISYLSCVCEHEHVHSTHLWVWAWVCDCLFVLFIQAVVFFNCTF